MSAFLVPEKQRDEMIMLVQRVCNVAQTISCLKRSDDVSGDLFGALELVHQEADAIAERLDMMQAEFEPTTAVVGGAG